MSKKYVSVFLQSIGMQIMFSIVSMIFYINITIYTVFTAWLFMFPLYSTYWKLGNKDGKMIIIHNRNLKAGDEPKKKNLFKGALIALPYFMINIILLLLTYYTNNDILLIIETAITFPFAGFLPPLTDILGAKYLLSRLIVCFAIYLTCILGYMTGIINFSLLDKYYIKIIYKNTPKKEN